MKNFKSHFKKLLSPSIPFAVGFSILACLVIALTITLVVLGYTNSIIIYLLYCIAAVSLTYLVYIIIYFAPKIKNNTIKLLKKHKFTNELLESYGYRSIIFASFSFIFNILYSSFLVVVAIVSKSIWYGALSGYYIIISLIRGGLVAAGRKYNSSPESIKKQLKSYRNCGIYLVILNFALVAAIVQMVLSDGGFKYAGLMIYVMATYTFYKLGMGIYNIIKAKKHNDPTIQSIKNISFADALVSLLALQTALLAAFSEDYKPALPNSLTGGAVSIAIISIGIIMIINGTKRLKTLNKENSREQ